MSIRAPRAVPEPLPAPLAAELLALRARAEFAAGRTLDGMRTIEARARLLSGAEEKTSVFVDWGWNVLTQRRGKRIILTDEVSPV